MAFLLAGPARDRRMLLALLVLFVAGHLIGGAPVAVGDPWPTSIDREIAAPDDLHWPAIAAATDGRLVVALAEFSPTGGAAVTVLRSNTEGEQFQPMGLFWNPDPIINYTHPDLAVLDDSGLVVLAMLEQIFGGFKVTVATSPIDGPTQWTTSTALTAVDLQAPRLVVWEEGLDEPELHLLVRSLVVVWGSGGPPQRLDNRLLYLRSSDGGASWSDPATLAAVVFPADIHASSLAIGGDGQVHVAYTAGPEGESALYYLRHPDRGDASTPWDTTLQLTAGSANTRQTDVAAGSTSPYVFVLHQGDDGNLRVAWSENGGDSFPLLNVIVTEVDDGPDAPRVVERDDEAHVTYTRDGTRLFYRNVPLAHPTSPGAASAVSLQGEPLTLPHYDVTVRAGDYPDAGPAVTWLSSDGSPDRTPYVDAFWFPPAIGIDDQPVSASMPALSIRALPNPFGSSLAMDLELGQSGLARVAVYDPSGRLVRRLSNREFAAGQHQISWDGSDDRGRALPAGVYFLTVRTANSISTRRVVRLP